MNTPAANNITLQPQPLTRLLLVDDQPDLLCGLAEILQHHGFAVVSTLDGEDAIEIAAVYRPSVLITDFQLPGIDGVTVIERMRQLMPELRAVLVSGNLSHQAQRRARAESVDAMFQKPVRITELLEALIAPPEICAT